MEGGDQMLVFDDVATLALSTVIVVGVTNLVDDLFA